MTKRFISLTSFFAMATLYCSFMQASQAPIAYPKNRVEQPLPSKSSIFTGKIIGTNVRMRIAPDLESSIVREFSKGDYVLITGEKGDFYSVQAPKDLKSYIFRGFVVDNTVQGDRVNIRLSPNRDAPIIAHYSTGDMIQEPLVEVGNKMWLEIPTPENAKFYIAKEYVQYAGNRELKAAYD